MNKKQIRTELEALANQHGIRLAVKEESLMMRLFALILFFNPRFLDGYITTFGEKVYYPRHMLDDDHIVITTLPHEMVHIHDSRMNGVIYILSYLSPQIFALFSVMACFSVWNGYNMLWLLSLLFLLPVPSHGRANIEIRGFAMSMAVWYWMHNDQRSEPPDYIIDQFTGRWYYWMWPFRQDIEEKLMEWLDHIHRDELYGRLPFAGEIKRIIKKGTNYV